MELSGISRRIGRAAVVVGLMAAGLIAGFAVPASAQTLSYGPETRYGQAFAQQAFPQYAPQAQSGGAADQELAPALRRQIVEYPTGQAAGTVVIDTVHTFLYLTLGSGKAMRYGIGVGREGFTWSGVQTISRKAEWPDWTPPPEMVARQPYLPRWVGGGPGNPLGARALYLGHTDYRIHGTNDPTSIGKHVSSGCIRLRNADVIDLYGRVGIGTKVVVLAGGGRNVSVDTGHGRMSAVIPVGLPAEQMASGAPAAGGIY
jgi:lipoprotein-anchoring transpeptidase ErfK/SrfK